MDPVLGVWKGPLPLTEHIKVGLNIFEIRGKGKEDALLRKLDESAVSKRDKARETYYMPNCADTSRAVYDVLTFNVYTF